MKKTACFIMTGLFVFVLLVSPLAAYSGALIIDHRHTDITQIPQSAIEQAKASLHIAYGHTSHGSQVTTGMNGLVDFANGGGKGLTLPEDVFEWNNGGTGGALDLHDYAMGGDVGYYPAWYNNTVSYLNNPANSDVNVIMWSWCGQVGSKYAGGTLFSDFLNPMTQLEIDYPGVTFVYMTGHVEHSSEEDRINKAANGVIRDYCETYDKVLFDFADIECYDPNGVYYAYPDDSCAYYASWNGSTSQGNWATEWQDAHVEDVDWYDCGAAHSESLNANQKAYAVWWMFARLAGWTGTNETGCDSNIADADCDGKVNMADLVILSGNWLDGV